MLRALLSSGARRGYYRNYRFLHRSIGVLDNHPKERIAWGGSSHQFEETLDRRPVRTGRLDRERNRMGQFPDDKD